MNVVLGLAGKIIDRVVPDKVAAEKAKFELEREMQGQDFQLAIEQIKVNAEEAKNSNIFVSGWRPFIGWVCGVGFAYNFLVHPTLLWILAVFNSTATPPNLAGDSLMELTLGMLGMGTIRMMEKIKGVARN